MNDPGRLARPDQILIWDLDGTIADTRRDIAEGVAGLLRARDLPPLPLSTVLGHVGQGVRHLVFSCLAAVGRPPESPEEVTAAVEIFRAHYRRHLMDTTTTYGDLAETLRRLQRQGRVMAVVSNKPADLTREILERLGLLSCFAAVLGGDSLAVRKPDPEPLHVALRLCNPQATVDQAIVVGDSIYDAQAARAAGMAMCAVGWGLDFDGALRAAHSDWWFDLPEELGRALLPESGPAT